MNDIVPTTDQPADLVEQSENTSLAFVMPNDFPDLDQAEIGMRIEKKYFEFADVGQRVRAIFNGMDHIVSKNNGARTQIPAIVFQTKDGIWLHAGASLVEQFRTIPAGTPVQITYMGKEKTASGNNVSKFDVHLLRVGVKAVKVEHAPEQPAPAKPKVEEQIPSEPGSPEPPDHLVFTNTELATDFWTQARSMGLDRKEGLAHLATFENDFKEALEALKSF